jgi:hypothetical protein
MLNILIALILLIITGSSLYMIDKLFVENISIKPEGPVDKIDKIDTIDISSDYIIVLSMENCPYCEILQKDYISKTDKKHTVITYKSRDKTFRFDTNFVDIPKQERENIIDEVDKFLKGPSTFPTIIHNKKITRGLVHKDLLNKIFT